MVVKVMVIVMVMREGAAVLLMVKVMQEGAVVLLMVVKAMVMRDTCGTSEGFVFPLTFDHRGLHCSSDREDQSICRRSEVSRLSSSATLTPLYLVP
ncbi:hypothetical protein E2C01_079713 [Portunus trituberculatus]|uniref:Uncharacterized protein n=1 Tax=Portunus trituberculatus TaxID=210409 RepID=A0A5B7IWC6_PORTR|nr:hypothetical protein [Portunus trituberculatus]